MTFQLTSGGFSRGNVARKRNGTLTDTKTSEACVAAGSSTYRPPSCSQEGVSPGAAGREPLAAGPRCECSPCLVPEAHLHVSLSKSPATALSCDTNEASQVSCLLPVARCDCDQRPFITGLSSLHGVRSAVQPLEGGAADAPGANLD